MGYHKIDKLEALAASPKMQKISHVQADNTWSQSAVRRTMTDLWDVSA